MKRLYFKDKIYDHFIGFTLTISCTKLIMNKKLLETYTCMLKVEETYIHVLKNAISILFFQMAFMALFAVPMA